MSTITAANAVVTLAIPGLFPIPQTLAGFAADNVYEVGSQDVTETLMGVDGRLSGGYVYNPVEQTFSIQADSETNRLFELWASTQRTNKDAYFANGETTLISVGRSYISRRGFLISLPPLPTANKVLQPRRYVLRWESVTAANI